jgi:hypothetical protein
MSPLALESKTSDWTGVVLVPWALIEALLAVLESPRA